MTGTVSGGTGDPHGPAVRVALDLMGGDAAPAAVLEAAALVAAEQPDVELTLVGPAELAGDRFRVVHASEVVGMSEDPARAIRAKRDATLRVAARLVRDGEADATVSAGSTGAALAAALFTLGRLPGITRPAVAVVVPAVAGPVVLLDAGGNVDVEPAVLGQFAMLGSAYAEARLGIDAPRVGLLSNGEEAGKGDELRKRAYDVLAGLPLRFAGNVEGRDVPLGERADVVVTDGFTGNVLLKALEGSVRMLAGVVLGAAGDAALEVLRPAFAAAARRIDPEELGGAVLLGVKGVSVVAHGSSSPRAIASAVREAAYAVRGDLVGRTATALEPLVSARRAAP